ncbi:MAG: MBL fold metallo-hydrolase [Saccharofermentanales bacterium]
MKIHKFPFGPIDANMYVVETDKACVIIDPCVSLSVLPEFSSPFKAIIITHCHYDHVNRMEELRDALKIPVYAHAVEFPSFGDPTRNGAAYFMSDEEFSRPDHEILDNDEMMISDDVSLRFIHTPGHTMGSICILVLENGRQTALFSGDTLFLGTVGRTDLSGSPSMLLKSLQVLSRLDDQVAVYSGHGDDTTILNEKQNNPFMIRAVRHENKL